MSDDAESRPFDGGVSRRPLERGNIYRFLGFPRSGFKILGVVLPGYPDYDGGLPGVVFQWQRLYDRGTWFYPCRSEAEFWADLRFASACDPEVANVPVKPA